jgi:hypothetical protein
VEIPDPPAGRACLACARPLLWLFSARTGAWVGFVPDPADTHVLHVHRCGETGPLPSWRDALPLHVRSPEVAERAHRGAALAAAAIRRKNSTEGDAA